MKTSKLITEFIIVLIVIAPIVYFFYLWTSLPDTLPIHFDINGNPDNYGSKNVIALTIFLLSAGIYVFLKFIPRVYNKSRYIISHQMFDKTRLFVSLFFSILCFIILFSVQQGKANNSIVYISIAFLISILGNYMGSIKPNFLNENSSQFVVENEMKWKKTQNFIGKLWFFSGIALALMIYILPSDVKIVVFITGLILLGIIIPVAYSLQLYFKAKQNINKTETLDNQLNTQNIKNRNSDPWIGLFYVNASDKRLFVPKRTPGMGWTLNFGNPYTYIVIIAFVSLIIIYNYFIK